MNKHILVGLQCPECGSFDPLIIETQTNFCVWDEGFDIKNSKINWDENSKCTCGICKFHGTVKDFKLEKSND